MSLRLMSVEELASREREELRGAIYPKPVALGETIDTDRTEYVTLLTWIVGGRGGTLRELSIYSDRMDKALWRITIMREVLRDKEFQTATTWTFPPNYLPPGSLVKVEVKSGDGTMLKASATIGACEYHVMR